MSIPVALERLGEAIEEYGEVVYLLTAATDGRPHAVAVSPHWTGDWALAMSAGGRSRANVAERPAVSLLWPAPEPGGYTLIVDGDGTVTGDGEVAVTPTRGVLHRPVSEPAEPRSGCTADCVPLLPGGDGSGR